MFVIIGMIDVWIEVVSVGVYEIGDLMFMYGMMMFFVVIGEIMLWIVLMWIIVGVFEGICNFVGGFLIFGVLIGWFWGLSGVDYFVLFVEVEDFGFGV